MEDTFDFQIDFNNISALPDFSEAPEAIETPETVETPESQESDLYEEIVQGSRKTYRCTNVDCGKIFKFKSEITRHVIIHQKERPYCCTYSDCKKAFKRADALENHMRIHAGIHPYACNVPDCDKTFVTKAALRYHQIKHNNNRVFKCEFAGCNKSFLTPSQLKQHQKSYNFHTGPLPKSAVEEEPVKVVKSQPKVQDKCEERFVEPAQKSADNNIQWEIKSQTHENEDLDENTQEKFEMIFKYILTENKILKDQLQERKKLPTSLERKQTWDFSRDNQIQFLQSQESSSFFDGYELKFLEFLKDREESSF